MSIEASVKLNSREYTEQQATDMGTVARYEGQPYKANPFRKWTVSWAAWGRGWKEANVNPDQFIPAPDETPRENIEPDANVSSSFAMDAQ